MRASPSRTTLEHAFDPRANGLTVMRLALAGVVAVAHTLQLAAGWQPVLGRDTELGGLAVDAFFVVSGFLVTGSLLRLQSARRYAWHRFLRIMPGFWTCLVVTALVVAPLLALLTGRSPSSVFTGADSAQGFVANNALLLMRQFEIGALGSAIPGDGVMNGALWTLFYEAVCYGVVLGLGLVGVLQRRRWAVLALTAGLQALTIAQAAGLLVVPQERLLRLALMFLLGACALLFAGRVPVTRLLVILAAATVAVGIAGWSDYRVVGAAGFAYLMVVLAARSPLRWEPGFDLSYGLYVYHWPVALLLVAAAGAVVPAFLMPVLVLALTIAVAAASWRFVESPALRMKSARWVTAPLRRHRPGPSGATAWEEEPGDTVRSRDLSLLRGARPDAIRAGRRADPGTRPPSRAA